MKEGRRAGSQGSPAARLLACTRGRRLAGFPLSGLVTSRQLADTFASGGMEFFATFGGCHAAAAAGLAVLAVLREERLQDSAARVGAYLLARLRELQVGSARAVGVSGR